MAVLQEMASTTRPRDICSCSTARAWSQRRARPQAAMAAVWQIRFGSKLKRSASRLRSSTAASQ